jgi:putative transposase
VRRAPKQGLTLLVLRRNGSAPKRGGYVRSHSGALASIAMPRVLRTTLPDGYFHVFARGVDETAVFADAEDRRSFLGLLLSTGRRCDWQFHTLCLMTTHYHLVLESARDRLSAGMQWLNGVYAQSFNKRHGRHGHLFGGRFGTRVIEDEEYLRQACDYVLLNPVRAGLCERAADWPWSATRYRFPEA